MASEIKTIFVLISHNLCLFIIVYFTIINAVAFAACGLDKHYAKNGLMRIREKSLLLLAFLGGSLFMLLGMIVFRHKTKKTSFIVLIPLFLLMHLSLLLFFEWKYKILSELFSILV